MALPTKEKQSPANGKLELPKGYKPLTGSTLRLEVPEKLGWHRHWFRGTPARLQRAAQAGYRFVDHEDVDVNNFDLAGDSKGSGSTDMGTRVSVVSGDGAEANNQPSRMYLMECSDEIFAYAQSILQQQVDSTADALRGGSIGSREAGESSEDSEKRYTTKTGKNTLFNRKS